MKNIVFVIFSLISLLSCKKEIIDSEISVIPQPASVEIYSGTFNPAGASFVIDEKFCDYALTAISDFEDKLVSASGKESGSSSSKFIFKKDSAKAKEEYSIDVNGNKAVIEALDLNGVLYAIETIRQLLPSEIYTGSQAESAIWELPYMSINDIPRFGYRGMHLDVSRHFFDLEEVKRYINIMAVHKLNVLHWHLTDDQGWRLEIKKYPELTKIGAVRNKTLIGHIQNSDKYDNVPYGEGCYFTQEQAREIIRYAASKGIEVIPEIDLPGHMLAALASFPELGCTGGPYEVWGRWGIADDVLCVGKEKTMKFLEDVLAEVADLFPSEYIHIGGDECPKIRWEKCPHCQAKIKELGIKGDDKHSPEHYLQSYVTSRMESFLKKKGKKIIGWDEILEGELAPNATVMSWRGVEGGLEAVRLGHDAIMVPYTHLYFDYYQSKDIEKEPLAIGGYLPVEKVYSFEPFTSEMNDEDKSHILGVQANLWTEYIPTSSQLEYMLLPRLSALSEIQWCEPENKDYDRFLEHMCNMKNVYIALGYNYANHIFQDR